MYEIFEQHICADTSFNAEELALIRARAVQRSIRRKELLLREGEICRHKTFVLKGLLRCYLVNEDGTESILRFTPEKDWMLDARSYNTGTPSRYSIEALEDSCILQWSKENMDWLFENIPQFRTYSEQLRTTRLDDTQNRVMVNISYSAEQKYQDFIETYPEIFQRVPLHMVASYLGVSRETLSRIRHAQMKQHK